ncbi:IS3 family transposase [Kitasatospora purpeofusca]|uniref:IS3 family transposase n=1 Tax=Kitasatospora purpeofusca TaxID=67352 RepID=UPI0036D42C84
MIRFRFVEDHHGAWGVKRICRVLGIARSSFYDWRAGEQARRDRERAEDLLAAEITVIYLASRGAYGVPRVHAELRGQGRAVNRKRVERIMRERGIAGVTRRRRHGLTRQARKPVHVPDLIGRDFSAPRPGMRLVGDMTFLPTEEGWLYLATCIDLARWTARDLAAVAGALNTRPRKTLGWRTPAEALDDQLLSLQTSGVATTP